ncbi:hypothetical protein [Sulfurisphaera tokodaii]
MLCERKERYYVYKLK